MLANGTWNFSSCIYCLHLRRIKGEQPLYHPIYNAANTKSERESERKGKQSKVCRAKKQVFRATPAIRNNKDVLVRADAETRRCTNTHTQSHTRSQHWNPFRERNGTAGTLRARARETENRHKDDASSSTRLLSLYYIHSSLRRSDEVICLLIGEWRLT